MSGPEGLSAGGGWERDVKWCGPAVTGGPVVHLEPRPHAGRWYIPAGRRDAMRVPARSLLRRNMKVKLLEHHLCGMLRWKPRMAFIVTSQELQRTIFSAD